VGVQVLNFRMYEHNEFLEIAHERGGAEALGIV
jgi:hypothetical protein